MIAPLLAVARKRFPSLKKAIADGGSQGKASAEEVQTAFPLRSSSAQM
jgi:hypothetical protein